MAIKKPIAILDEIEKAYEGYADFAVSELKQVEMLRTKLQEAKDPMILAYRENPYTIKLFKHCASLYKQAKLALANDDGKLSSDERSKLHISSIWARWFMLTLGGSPAAIEGQVQEEIMRFAVSIGVDPEMEEGKA